MWYSFDRRAVVSSIDKSKLYGWRLKIRWKREKKTHRSIALAGGHNNSGGRCRISHSVIDIKISMLLCVMSCQIVM